MSTNIFIRYINCKGDPRSLDEWYSDVMTSCTYIVLTYIHMTNCEKRPVKCVCEIPISPWARMETTAQQYIIYRDDEVIVTR